MNGTEPAHAARGEPSIGALVGTLVDETGTLVRQEIRLASTEMSQKAKAAALDMGVVGLGGGLVHAGILALTAAIILGLGTLIPMWVSALIIGVLVTAGGALVMQRGVKALRAIDPLPQRTIETLRDDKVWLKEQVR